MKAQRLWRLASVCGLVVLGSSVPYAITRLFLHKPVEAPVAAKPKPGPVELRGASIGMNGPMTHELIDSVHKDLKIGWVRGGPEWGFHETEADYQRDVDNRANGITWPGLVEFRDWAAYAHANGVRVLTVALASPKWVHGRDRTDGGNSWHQAVLPQHRGAFAEYCKQLCLEGADAVEVLNEPNLRFEYSFGPDHPRAAHPEERVDDYVMLLRAVHDAIKADPRTARCLVGIGGTAAGGHEQLPSEDILPVPWYHALFHAHADDRKTPVSIKGHFDFATVHPYAEFNTGDGPSQWGHRWTRFFNQYGDAVYAHGMANVHRIRAELVAGGEADKKLWASEVGVATYGGTCQAKPCVSERTQSDWVPDYLRVWLTSEKTGWRAPLAERFYGDFTGPIFFYQWRDRSDGKVAPTDKEGFFGLQRYDGSEKPAFLTLASEAAKVR